MTEREALIEAILDDLEQDGPRLVFADWLDEHGEEAAAEFLRLECEAARLEKTVWKEAQPLKRRARAVFDANRAAWLGPLDRPKSKLCVCNKKRDRGVLQLTAQCTAETFAEKGPGWVAAVALPAVIHARPTGFGKSALDALAQSPALERVVRLDASYGLSGPAEVRRLVSGNGLRRLRGLVLAGIKAGGDECLGALAGAACLGRLEELEVSWTELTAASLGAVAGTRTLLHLRRLALYFTKINAGPRPLRAGGPPLTELALSYNRDFGDAGARWLASSPGLAELRRLDLSGCGIGPEGVAALTSSRHLGRLEVLELSNNAIGNAGARILAEPTALRSLRRVTLWQCEIGSAGAQALAYSAHPFEWVSMSNNPLRPATRDRLQKVPRMNIVQ